MEKYFYKKEKRDYQKYNLLILIKSINIPPAGA